MHRAKTAIRLLAIAAALAGPAAAGDAPGPLDLLLQAVPRPDLAITVTGYQYGWRYDYPEAGGSGRCRVEGALVLPQGKVVELTFTADDVIHEWTVPALDLRKDAIPGLLTVLSVETALAGTFAGGATPVSGAGHAAMAFELRILPPAAYAAWQKDALSPCRAP